MRSNPKIKSGSGAYILSSTLPERYRTSNILNPSKTPSADLEASYVAFYTVVVSLIWLNGGELSEQKLRRYLTRLNADQNIGADPTAAVLKRMEKHNYVVKNMDTSGQDGEESITWTIGPRAREEIGLDGVAGIVREVWGGSTPELEQKLQASLGVQNTSEEAGGEGQNAEEDGDGGRGDEED